MTRLVKASKGESIGGKALTQHIEDRLNYLQQLLFSTISTISVIISCSPKEISLILTVGALERLKKAFVSHSRRFGTKFWYFFEQCALMWDWSDATVG